MGYSSIIYIGGGEGDITLRVFDAYVRPSLEQRGLKVGDKTGAKLSNNAHRGTAVAVSNRGGQAIELDTILSESLREAATMAFDVKMGRIDPPYINGKKVDERNPGKFVEISSGADIGYSIPLAAGCYEILAQYKRVNDASLAFPHVHRNLFGIRRRSRNIRR